MPPPEVMHVLHEKNKKPRPMIPESDVIKAARARAAAAGAEQPAVVVSAAAQELKVSAKAKGEKAAAARRAAVAEAAKARAAAAKASELASLAEEAKAVAAGLEKARASGPRSAKQDEEDEKPNLDDVASDELARRLHSEMNASPRSQAASLWKPSCRRAAGVRRLYKTERPHPRDARETARMSTTTTANVLLLAAAVEQTHFNTVIHITHCNTHNTEHTTDDASLRFTQHAAPFPQSSAR